MRLPAEHLAYSFECRLISDQGSYLHKPQAAGATQVALLASCSKDVVHSVCTASIYGLEPAADRSSEDHAKLGSPAMDSGAASQLCFARPIMATHKF